MILPERPDDRASVDMTALATSVWDACSAEHTCPDVSFDLVDLPPTFASEALLARLWQELFTNAIAFRRPDRPLRVRVSGRISADDPKQCVYDVIDNGIGIDPKFRNSVFDLFRTLSPYSKTQREGLGLAIARDIVAWHGGHISIAGAEENERGTCVRFVLPAQ
jgi:signal transduction histidine kinase